MTFSHDLIDILSIMVFSMLLTFVVIDLLMGFSGSGRLAAWLRAAMLLLSLSLTLWGDLLLGVAALGVGFAVLACPSPSRSAVQRSVIFWLVSGRKGSRF